MSIQNQSNPFFITEFSRNYKWLSNFYSHRIEVEGDSYHTAEHAYQASKAMDREERVEIMDTPSPADAKKIGRNLLSIRGDWDDVKVDVMREILAIKFSDPELSEKLIATGDAVLIEGNNHGDRFWGVYKGRGHNMLGKLLMELRDDLVTARAEKAKYLESNQPSTSDATTIPQSNQA